MLEKVSLKGQTFKILEAVSDEDLRRQFAFVHDIDPTLQLGIGQKSELLKKDDLQAWSKKHFRVRQYSFQIKKCDQAPPSEVHKEKALEEIQSKVECLPPRIQQLVNSAIQQVKSIEGLVMLMQAVKAGWFGVDVVRAALDLQSCTTCKAPRASLDTFKKLMWLPDPLYKDASKEHYKAFEDLLGQNTSEIDRPSAKSNVDDKPKHLMKKERVRDAIECVACKKWRCMFAATKPTAAQMEQLSEITDVLQYSCGAPLIPEDQLVKRRLRCQARCFVR